jgi:hypothetical protein
MNPFSYCLRIYKWGWERKMKNENKNENRHLDGSRLSFPVWF